MTSSDCTFYIELTNSNELKANAAATGDDKVIPTSFLVDLSKDCMGTITKYQRQSDNQYFRVSLENLIIPNSYIDLSYNKYDTNSTYNSGLIKSHQIDDHVVADGGRNFGMFDTYTTTPATTTTEILYNRVHAFHITDSDGELGVTAASLVTFSTLPTAGAFPGPTAAKGITAIPKFTYKIASIVMTVDYDTPYIGVGSIRVNSHEKLSTGMHHAEISFVDHTNMTLIPGDSILPTTNTGTTAYFYYNSETSYASNGLDNCTYASSTGGVGNGFEFTIYMSNTMSDTNDNATHIKITSINNNQHTNDTITFTQKNLRDITKNSYLTITDDVVVTLYEVIRQGGMYSVVINNGGSYDNCPGVVFLLNETVQSYITLACKYSISNVEVENPGSMYTSTEDGAVNATAITITDGIDSAYITAEWELDSLKITDTDDAIATTTATSVAVTSTVALPSSWDAIGSRNPLVIIQSHVVKPSYLPYLYANITGDSTPNFFTNNPVRTNRQFRVIIDDESFSRTYLTFKSCATTLDLYLDLRKDLQFSITTPDGNPLTYTALTDDSNSPIRPWEWTSKQISSLFRFDTVALNTDGSKGCMF